MVADKAAHINRCFALDTETDGLYGRILGFSTKDDNHDAQAWEATPHNLSLLRRKLELGYIPVFWNAAYDLEILDNIGIHVEKYYDAMIAEYNYCPAYDSYSLEEAAIRHDLITRKVKVEHFHEWNEELESRARTDAQMTWEIWCNIYPLLQQDARAWSWYVEYDNEYARVIQEMQRTGLVVDEQQVARLSSHLNNKIDRLNQWLLRRKLYYFIPEVEADDNWDDTLVLYKRQVPLDGQIAKIPYEVKVPIDYELDKTEELLRVNTKTKIIKRTGWQLVPGTSQHTVGCNGHNMYDHCDLPLFNPASGADKARALMDAGWKPEKFTKKTGQPLTKNEILENIDIPLAHVLVTYAGCQKMLSSFLDKLTPDADGFLRTSFSQVTTRTGRLSSFANERGGLNFQNIPARGNYGKLIRNMIVCPKGYRIVDIDLSNIELRVLAHYLSKYCADNRMTETFEAGINIHDANSEMWGLPRPDAKTAIFALLYGAWDEKLGKGNKARGAEIRAAIDDKMPAIQALKEKVWKSCADHGGWFHTEFGQRLYYPNLVWDNAYAEACCMEDDDGLYLRGKAAVRMASFLQERAKRQVFNAALQGTAANILKILQLKTRGAYVYKTEAMHGAAVHDESLYYVLEKWAEEFANTLDTIYKTELLSNCPIKGDAKVGNTWREVH